MPSTHGDNMKVFNTISDIPPAFKGSAIAIGNFDALHLGHQKIISTCNAIAKEHGIKSGLITFHPHPVEVLNNSKTYHYINSHQQQLKLLEDFGLDFVYVVKFDTIFAEMSPEEFIESFLVSNFAPAHIVTGANFNFGKKRQGNAQLLEKYSNLYTYHPVELVKFRNLIISTTIVKDHLQTGRIIAANFMLGRTLSYEGIVIKGSGIATKVLETPTANLDVDFANKFLPLKGVYLAKTSIDGVLHYGIINLGVKPTVSTLNQPSLELHIFDFDRDIYNIQLKVGFLGLIRPERNFKNTADLKKQIFNDIRLAKYALKSLAHYHLYAE